MTVYTTAITSAAPWPSIVNPSPVSRPAKPVELQRLDMGQGRGISQARDVRNRRMRAEIEKDAICLDLPRAARCQTHLDGASGDEAAFAMDLHQAVDHRAFAPAHARHVGRHRTRPLSIVRRAPREVGHLGAVDHILARQARDVRARAADQSAFHDDSSPPPRMTSSTFSLSAMVPL
jgi:hypothetical protein